MKLALRPSAVLTTLLAAGAGWLVASLEMAFTVNLLLVALAGVGLGLALARRLAPDAEPVVTLRASAPPERRADPVGPRIDALASQLAGSLRRIQTHVERAEHDHPGAEGRRQLRSAIRECERGGQLLADGLSTPDPGETPTPSPKRSAGLGKVLVCDDEPAVRSLLQMCLAERGYTVFEAANLATAVEQAERHASELDLLICDLDLRGSSGWDVASAVRRLAPGLRVLLTSGHGKHAVDPDEAEAADVSYLPKPFSPGELFLCVEKMLTR